MNTIKLAYTINYETRPGSQDSIDFQIEVDGDRHYYGSAMVDGMEPGYVSLKEGKGDEYACHLILTTGELYDQLSRFVDGDIDDVGDSLISNVEDAEEAAFLSNNN